MRWAGHVAWMEEKRNTCGLMVGKPEGRTRLGRRRRRWMAGSLFSSAQLHTVFTAEVILVLYCMWYIWPPPINCWNWTVTRFKLRISRLRAYSDTSRQTHSVMLTSTDYLNCAILHDTVHPYIFTPIQRRALQRLDSNMSKIFDSRIMFIVWRFLSLKFLMFYIFVLPHTLVVTHMYFSVLYGVHLRLAHVGRNM
jgi:hypothetical protein